MVNTSERTPLRQKSRSARLSACTTRAFVAASGSGINAGIAPTLSLPPFAVARCGAGHLFCLCHTIKKHLSRVLLDWPVVQEDSKGGKAKRPVDGLPAPRRAAVRIAPRGAQATGR